MTVLDLAHYIDSSMPVYPGTEPPVIDNATTIEAQGFAEKRISMFSHTGTHIDAPGHILPGAPTLDRLAIDRFAGRGLVIDLPATAPGRVVTEEDLAPWMSSVENAQFALFRFDWSRLWERPEYFSGYPLLSEGAAALLARSELKGVGVDCISVDAIDSTDFPIHNIFFHAGMILIENLTGLEELIGKTFIFTCFPLKLRAADGSPVRAAALIEG